MKGVVLAGGTGSRLRPITHTGPKQLVPVGNKPVIDYGLEDLREAGIKEVGVVLGNKGREAIQDHLGDGSEFGLDITYIVQGDPLGLAHAVGCARDFVGGEPFVVYLGDNMMAGSITAFVDDFDPSIYAAGIGVQEIEEPSRYGIVDVDDQGEITRLLEKPAEPPTNLALIGVYVFTPAIFDRIEALEPSGRGELEITEAIQNLLEDGYAVQSHVVEGWWKDTGKPEDILHANRQVLDKLERRVEGTIADGASVRGRVEVGEDSTIESDAVVRGPVSIGEETTVHGGAYVGPYTSIGDGCLVRDAHIESSVVIGDAEIRCDRVIVDSLVGRHAEIVSDRETRPNGMRVTVGENSSLRL